MIDPAALTTTAASNLTYVVRDKGRVVSMFSNDPYYRLFRAMADLFIAGQVDADDVSMMVGRWAHLMHDGKLTSCPAAAHVMRSMTLAVDEPSCLCDPYRENPCDCEPMDRRARLRELLGA